MILTGNTKDLKAFVSIKNYLVMATEPVHVGSGGYRLGRVDNTIIREPATDLPKLPGTGLAGVARAYTAMAVQSANHENNQKMKKFLRRKLDKDGKEENDKNGTPLYVSCAGKGGEEGEEHCGENNCPVCLAFGFSKGESKSSFQGLSSFADARLLLFPINSMKGPVWITCRQALEDFDQDNRFPEVQNPHHLTSLPDGPTEDHYIITAIVNQGEPLNLGWVLLNNQKSERPLTLDCLPEEIRQRTVLVSDAIFSRLVNDNLEVRTSVAIDPATGAAEERALYTYEALPRGSILWFPIRYQNPKNFLVGGKEPELSCDAMITWVERGLRLMGILGVGGKGTRGMGRLKLLNMTEEIPGG